MMMSTESQKLRAGAERVREAFKRPTWWVLGFGWSLACCAGAVNAVSFRTFGHFVSHATGATTSIALGIQGFADGRHGWEEPDQAIKLLSSFLLGAFACGLLIDKNQVHFGDNALYGAALVVNAFLLFFSVILFEANHGSMVSASFAACACGLQNAMCTSHLGAVVRTTHVTGTLTDIGSTAGRLTMIAIRRRLRRRALNVMERAEVDVDMMKLMALGPMWLSFFMGTFVGAFFHKRLGTHALLIPACFTFFGGLAYMLLQQRMRLQMKNMEREQLLRDIGMMAQKISAARGVISAAKASGVVVSPSSTSAVAHLREDFGDLLQTIRSAEVDLQGLYGPGGVVEKEELGVLPEGGPDQEATAGEAIRAPVATSAVVGPVGTQRSSGKE